MIEIEGIVAWSGTGTVEPAGGLERLDLTVENLRRAAAFYRRVFGFRARTGDGSSRSLVMAAGAAALVLHERSATTPGSPAHRLRRWGFVVADLDRVRQAVWDLGIGVARDSGEPDHIYRGRKRHTLYIRDPDGNDIELLEFVSDGVPLTTSTTAAARVDASRDMLRTPLETRAVAQQTDDTDGRHVR